MNGIPVLLTCYQVAERFNGIVKEIPGNEDNPLILFMLQLTAGSKWPDHDEIPWCSAFVYFISYILGLDRPVQYGLRARSWLRVGRDVNPDRAEIGNDIVIIKRGGGRQPGPEVLDAKGHVGFFGGFQDSNMFILGGNQGNQISVARYPRNRLLGIRRLYL